MSTTSSLPNSTILNYSKYCVLVRIIGPDSRRLRSSNASYKYHNGSNTYLSCSGILFHMPDNINKKYIVCSGSIIAPFLISNSNNTLAPDVRIHILLESDTASDYNSTSNWREVKLHTITDIPNVQDAIDTLASAGSHMWRIGWSRSEEKDIIPNTPNKNLIPLSPLPTNSNIPLNNGHRITCGLTAILTFDAVNMPSIEFPQRMPKAPRGTLLFVFGSPYGLLSPRVFLNSISRGCIANIVPSSKRAIDSTYVPAKSIDTLIITDARCLPGCEGGLVVNELGEWLGMVTLPLSLIDGSAVELNLIISNATLLPWLRNIILNSPDSTQLTIAPAVAMVSPLLAAERAVVMVRIGSSWGTAIILSKSGYILTNAHVVRPYLVTASVSNGTASAPDPLKPTFSVGVKVYARLDHFHFQNMQSTSPATWVKAEAIYVSNGPWDIALLKLNDLPDLFTLPFNTKTEITFPYASQHVFAVGFPLFTPRSGIKATITHGVLSKITYLPGSKAPILYQTDISIHQGNSGGALFAIRPGFEINIIGMITSNVKHSRRFRPSLDQPEKEIATIIPSLNFSIPSLCLSALTRYIVNLDETELLSLERAPSIIKEIWQLQELENTPPSPVRKLPVDLILTKERKSDKDKSRDNKDPVQVKINYSPNKPYNKSRL